MDGPVPSGGGPVGQIGLMHLDVVERRKWLDDDEFAPGMCGGPVT